MNHLDNIIVRQRTSSIRDFFFAVVVAVAAVVSISTVSNAVVASHVQISQR